MKLESQDKMINCINEADYLIIGLGEEWSPSFEEMLLDTDFSKEIASFPETVLCEFELSMVKKRYFESFHSEQLREAYKKLYCLCREKQYFLVSLNQDKYPIMSGFKEESSVFPCGNYIYLQCEENCQNSLLDADEEYKIFFKRRNDEKKYDVPKCPFCHAPLAFNCIGVKKYCENGYMQQWQSYMRFLTQTVNRRLCLLELGVSTHYPAIIRSAFERTAIYNQKATLFRIHNSLDGLPELIQDRAYSKKENSVCYISNLFVSEQ